LVVFESDAIALRAGLAPAAALSACGFLNQTLTVSRVPESVLTPGNLRGPNHRRRRCVLLNGFWKGPAGPLVKARPMLWFVALPVALFAGLALICANVLLEMRAGAKERAIGVADRLVAAVENDILRNIESIDLSLEAVVDGLKRPDLPTLSPELRQVVLFDRST